MFVAWISNHPYKNKVNANVMYNIGTKFEIIKTYEAYTSFGNAIVGLKNQIPKGWLTSVQWSNHIYYAMSMNNSCIITLNWILHKYKLSRKEELNFAKETLEIYVIYASYDNWAR